MSNSSVNNKRIAKNTFVLYLRMLFLMAINLYTSRIVLQALGVEDYGVYNVVGGFVALFGVLSKSMSSATSRFLNYEMGKGNQDRLGKIFSTSMLIHLILTFVIVILAEIVGVWFVNCKMVVSPSRLYAANWVFQLSVLTFSVNLMTVPHLAAIIAHEKMEPFSLISIFEGVGQLIICFLLLYVSFDRLIYYAVLMFLIHFICRFLYYYYSKRHFLECDFYFIYEKGLLKEIFSFTGWNVIGSSSVILRNQGGNILINLFSGPTVNAARAIANQVLHAVNSFVENFLMALRPQITQSYAKGDMNYMMSLVVQGSRFSYYMIFIICLPILYNTDYILHLWLKNVPDHSSAFVRLTLLFAMIEAISGSLITAQLSTGRIKQYQIVVGGLQILNIPISYVILKIYGIPESILYVAIFISICCLFARLAMLRSMINLNVRNYISKVLYNIFSVSIVANFIPYIGTFYFDKSFGSFIAITLLCLVCSLLSIMFVGFSSKERVFITNKLFSICKKSKI